MTTQARPDWRNKPGRSPVQERARRITRSALNRGVISRPIRCENCGNIPPPRPDGKAAIQCHHLDYTKPMLIQWLCSGCHRKVTPISRHGRGILLGSRHPQAKLTEQDVLEIRASYQRGVVGFMRLAKRFSVSHTVIRDIINRRAWTHV